MNEKDRLIAQFELERALLEATITINPFPLYAPPAGYRLLDEPADEDKH